MQDNVVLGFDPGGASKFGVAALDENRVATATVGSVAEAMAWASDACGPRVPVAAGIDSLLHWCDGKGGWRPADRWLIEAYPDASQSVIAPNSLYGAMSVGGMALAIRLRERWGDIRLNETHPKVLGFAMRGARHKDIDPRDAVAWFANRSGLDFPPNISGHELDASLSAWATREGERLGWTDLVSNDARLIFPAGRVSYLWIDFPGAAQPVPRKAPVAARGVGKARASARASGKTTEIDYVNRNQQRVVQRTDLPGSDHGQRIYVLRCGNCGHEYGANGSDIARAR